MMTASSCMGQRVGIAGTGSYLPERVMTNADLETMVETSDEWIRTRTGIRERRIARDDEATSDMATEAARKALESADLPADSIDMIITATVTPDMFFPNTSCFVQRNLGASKASCFDVSAACSGFLYAVDVGRSMIATGASERILVVGAEKLSTITDWEDRSTCVLFGDGAGAVILQPETNGRGILASVSGSDGTLAGLLSIPGGGSRSPASEETLQQRLHFMKMSGNEVFKHAVRCMCDASLRVLEQGGLTIEDVDWFVPHQANMRIIQAIGNRLGDKSLEKFCINLDRVGNMSSASVPVALDECVKGGCIKKGDIVLMVAFGGGFTWGATVLEWSGE